MAIVDVPTSIDRTKVLDFVRSLGINPDDAIELRVGVHAVEVEVMARNEAGKAFSHPDGSLATHTISLDMHHDDVDSRKLGL